LVNPAIEPRRHLAHLTGICYDPDGVFSLFWEISPKNEKKILGGTGPAQPFFLIGEISQKREIDNSKMK
jgi:hypothetical protein